MGGHEGQPLVATVSVRSALGFFDSEGKVRHRTRATMRRGLVRQWPDVEGAFCAGAAGWLAGALVAGFSLAVVVVGGDGDMRYSLRAMLWSRSASAGVRLPSASTHFRSVGGSPWSSAVCWWPERPDVGQTRAMKVRRTPREALEQLRRDGLLDVSEIDIAIIRELTSTPAFAAELDQRFPVDE